MTDPLFGDVDDANTPLTPEEREGLIPTYVTLRSELSTSSRATCPRCSRSRWEERI